LFDQRLIELPLETNKPIEQQVSGTPEALHLEGMKAGVAEDGIVRQEHMNGGQPRMKKLPMRERLAILCKLGAGASSAVYKALDITDMRLVALKTIQVTESNKRVQMIREFSALFQLLREYSRRESSHLPLATAARPEKYIVSFYDAFHNQEDGVVCLMIEYMDGGSLQEIVDGGGCDDETTLANITVQALKGLNFLHNCNQIHRDLKPDNFLISHRGEVKVADLGIMKQMQAGPDIGHTKSKLSRTNTFVGTATYMSPERIDGKEYSYSSDIWAFGLSILTVALGKLPVDSSGGYWTILKSVRDSPSPSAPETYSPEFRDFIAKCLKKNPDERPSCKELLKHPFLKKARPEDLTYGQSDERGKMELQAIIRALHRHIHTAKKDVMNRYADEDDYLAQGRTPLSEKLLGNLWRDDPLDILHRLLFDEKREENNKRFTRPRLLQLSRQLHLPLELLLRTARQYYDELQAEETAASSR
jgi:serine/threonine protein kinase